MLQGLVESGNLNSILFKPSVSISVSVCLIHSLSLQWAFCHSRKHNHLREPLCFMLQLRPGSVCISPGSAAEDKICSCKFMLKADRYPVHELYQVIFTSSISSGIRGLPCPWKSWQCRHQAEHPGTTSRIILWSFLPLLEVHPLPPCFLFKWNWCPMFCFLTPPMKLSHWDLSYNCHKETKHLHTKLAQKQLQNVNFYLPHLPGASAWCHSSYLKNPAMKGSG